MGLVVNENVCKMGHPRPLFVYFRSFQTQTFKKLIHYADFSGIRTRIFGEEGQPFDHHHSPCLMKMPKNSEPTFHNFEGVKKA